jgi:hypothetical protein
MKFKLIVALVPDDETELVLQTAREAGATGSTVITSARGEGLKPAKTFFGLDLEGTRDMVLLLVEGHLSRAILEHIAASTSPAPATSTTRRAPASPSRSTSRTPSG